MNNKEWAYSYHFRYQNNYYPAGTEFIYNGECELDGQKVYLHYQRCKFIYCINGHIVCFQAGDKMYQADWFDHARDVKQLILPPIEQEKQEFYFTDDMFIKTAWYIVLMLVATLFHERVGLWILFTVVYIITTFCDKK